MLDLTLLPKCRQIHLCQLVFISGNSIKTEVAIKIKESWFDTKI